MAEYKVALKSDSIKNIDEFKTIANELFKEGTISVNEIKNRPWYKKFLNLVTLQQGDKIFVIKHIKDLGTLQTIFLSVYENVLKQQNKELDNIIETIIATQETVKKIYEKLILKSSVPGDINKIKNDPSAAKCLVDFLMLFADSANDIDEDLQQYNLTVKNLLNIQTPGHIEDFSILDNIDKNYHDAFYRCALEQCVVTNRFDFDDNTEFDFPVKVKEALEYLSVAPATKKRIEEGVKRECRQLGSSNFLTKYEQRGTSVKGLISISDELIEFREEVDTDRADIGTNKDRQSLEHQTKTERETVKHSFEELEQLVNGKITPEEKKSFLPSVFLKRPLGKILNDKEKDELLLKYFPNLERKTVINITEGKKYYLVFTTFALYIKQIGQTTGEKENYCVPYNEISEEHVITDVEPDKLIFDFFNRRIEYADDKIEINELKNLLLQIKNKDLFAPSDKRLHFRNLAKNVKIGYYHIVSSILRENSLSLAELFRDVVKNDKKLIYSWNEIVKDENELKDFILQWVENIPYPHEERLSRRLIMSICQLLQFTTNSSGLTLKQQKYFYDILYWIKESERDEVIRAETIGSHLEKDFMDKNDFSGTIKFVTATTDYKNKDLMAAGYKYIENNWVKPIFDFMVILEKLKSLYKETIKSYNSSLEMWKGLPESQKQEFNFEQTFNIAIEELDKKLKALGNETKIQKAEEKYGPLV